MKSQYDYEIIRDYLHGLTDGKTSREVGELIKRDETARSIAEGILLLEEEFKGNEEDVELYLDKFYQAQLNVIHKQIQPVRITQKLWFRIAASVLVLVIAGFTVRMLITRPDVESLIAQELSKPYPVSNLVRSEGSQTTEDRAYESYASGKYLEAAQYFSQTNGEARDVASATFYQAMSNLYVGGYPRAIQLFESPIISESRYVEQARWYQSLALLRSHNKTKAVEILRSIRANPQHFKYEDAGELLSQLE